MAEVDQKICSNEQMFDLLKVVIKKVGGYQNGRKTQETAFRHFYQA